MPQPLILVGTPLILFALIGRRVWGSLVVGLVGGYAFWGTLLLWITVGGPFPAMRQDVPLSTATTLATIAGQGIEATVSGVGLRPIKLGLECPLKRGTSLGSGDIDGCRIRRVGFQC